MIDEQRARGRAVESICQVLHEQGVQVAAQTCRARTRAHPSNRDLADAVIIDALLATFGTAKAMYGRRKMVALLRRRRHDVFARQVDRLMRHLDLNGRVRGQGVRTTIPDRNAARAPDLTTALRMGLWRRDRASRPAGDGLAHHSDTGSQFTSVSFAETPALEGIAASIGSAGDAYDNALADPTIGLFSHEAIRDDSPFLDGPLRQLADVEWVTLARVDWYNQRLHRTLGDVPPEEFETANHADSKTRAHPALTPAEERQRTGDDSPSRNTGFAVRG
ncbi:putative transposase [Microbacterium sp. SORGH_AS 1204]|uniref:transposase n=1 Tax=Microbacterium sp. SORGH_AS_1204 TaxID=3041785 RepID=UPI002794B384|nr:putative transposase [Microbacterium sp. SORGH_AS_1204]